MKMVAKFLALNAAVFAVVSTAAAATGAGVMPVEHGSMMQASTWVILISGFAMLGLAIGGPRKAEAPQPARLPKRAETAKVRVEPIS